jgi:hypothetical protein
MFWFALMRTLFLFWPAAAAAPVFLMKALFWLVAALVALMKALFWPAAAPVLAGYSSRGRPFLANTKLYFELLRTDGVEAAVAAFAA